MPPAPRSNDNDHVVGASDSLTIRLRITDPAFAAAAAAPAAAAPTAAKEKYPAKLHARKVAQELSCSDGLVFLPGLPTPLYEDSDMGPAFRQRRYFYYLGGTDFADCAVTYDTANDALVLWVPYIDPRQVLWYGTSPGPKECLAAIDVDAVHYTTELDAYLAKRLGVDADADTPAPAPEPISGASIGSSFCRDRDGRRPTPAPATAPATSPSWAAVARRPPPQQQQQTARPIQSTKTTLFLLHADQMPASLRGRGGAGLRVDTARLQPAMDAARVVKTPYEIAMIRKANAVSSSAHRAVLRRLKRHPGAAQRKPLASEADVEAVFLDHCRAVFGAKQQAYPVIAGAGAHAGVLHYFANDAPLVPGQLVCLDAGAEWALYASDVTRTFPVTGAFTPAAAAIYAAVARMQAAVFARFGPGAAFAYLHLHAAHVAAEALLALGLLRGGTATEILAQGTISAFFPHGLGHHVGLEVHDVLSPELMVRPPTDACADDDDDNDNDSDDNDALLAAAIRSTVGGRRGAKRQPVTPRMYAALVRAQQAATVAAAAPRKRSQPAPSRPKRCFLEPGMVVTVEPGIYFCRPYIESFFLSDPKHARFIDAAVLERYYAVGGVRIEDCLLVTADGHENLTTAPKGEEMLRIINGEA